MSERLIQVSTLTEIADAIRDKKGTVNPIPVSSYASEIATIETGGGGGGMLTAYTEEEMTALITTENEGKIVLYSGETGEYVNGEYYKITSSGDNTQYYELAELTSPATAEDIASGKEAYGADGVVITGTAESGFKYIYTSITPTANTTTITISDVGGLPHKITIGVSFYPNSTNYLLYGWGDNTENATTFYGYYTRYNNNTNTGFSVTYDDTTSTVTISNCNFQGGKKYDVCIIY